MGTPIYRFTGDDWNVQVTLKKDGVATDVSAASAIEASIVDSDGIAPATLVAAVTCDSGATGADWANGIVIVEIPNASTTSLDPQNAYMEIQVTTAGLKETWPRSNLVIKKGTIA